MEKHTVIFICVKHFWNFEPAMLSSIISKANIWDIFKGTLKNQNFTTALKTIYTKQVILKKMSVNSVNYLASITCDCSSSNVVIGVNCPDLAKITKTD